MKEIQRKWNFLSKEKRKSCIDEIMRFFKHNRDEEIGIIAAEDFLDFSLQNIGEAAYNRGIEDAKELLKQRFYDLEVDLDVLMHNK